MTERRELPSNALAIRGLDGALLGYLMLRGGLDGPAELRIGPEAPGDVDRADVRALIELQRAGVHAYTYDPEAERLRLERPGFALVLARDEGGWLRGELDGAVFRAGFVKT